MQEAIKPLLLTAARLSANAAVAQSPQPQGAKSEGQRHATIGTGSCSGALGAEPGCRRSHADAGAASAKSEGSDNDETGSATPSTDRMGPNAVGGRRGSRRSVVILPGKHISADRSLVVIGGAARG